MAEAVVGAAYGIETVIEGALGLAKGILYPTLPLKASLRPIADVDVPISHHSLSIIKGRAYVFGGKSGPKQLATNDTHVIILPSSGVESTDYKRIEATSGAPPRRYNHSAAVIDERIYVFGGCGENGEELEESGRVWVFDTLTNSWSHLDPVLGPQTPGPRSQHASVASDHPRPPQRRTDEGSLPQQPPDPASIVPEPPAADSYGTLLIHGGCSKDGTYKDLWTFDVSSRSWSALPSPPPPSTDAPSLAVVDQRLYVFSAGQTSYMDLTASAHDDLGGVGELGLAPLGPWSSLPPASSSPEKSYPGDRHGASLIPVTTGQGRHYLLLLGGTSANGDALQDLWTLQLKPEGMTAASFKDAARMALQKETHEAEWEEVKYHDAQGRMIQENQPGRGMGERKGCAVARGTEVDGATVVLWGGEGPEGKMRGDGLMITIDR